MQLSSHVTEAELERKSTGAGRKHASSLKLTPTDFQSTRFENLDIINSGTIPPNPSELLLKSSTSKLIEELKKSYEYIIIDSPPIGLVTDSLILSSSQLTSLLLLLLLFGLVTILDSFSTLNRSISCNGPTTHQCIDIVSSFIGVDRFQVTKF